MISHPKYKFGRKARIFDPRVKQLKTVLPQLPVAPPTADWTKGLTQFGMMLNDKLVAARSVRSITPSRSGPSTMAGKSPSQTHAY